MVLKPNKLFDDVIIKKICSKIKLTDLQIQSAKEWISMLEKNQLKKEKESQNYFETLILQEILGYDGRDCKREKEFVDYTIEVAGSAKSLCIEVKGTKTTDLFAYQSYNTKDKENPILQTWTYMGNGYDYGICTNYNNFVILSKDVGTKKVHKFNFLSMKLTEDRINEDKLKEFIAFFSKKEIFTNNSIDNATKNSKLAEQEFTGEFYKLFHETRLMLIKEFEQSSNISRETAIHWAQIFLNRLIFIYFVEDHNFIPDRLFVKRIHGILESPSIDESTQKIYDDILGLFKIMNTGSKVLGVNGFNGGLFEDEIPSDIVFPDLRSRDFFNECYQNSKLSLKSISVDISTSGIYGEHLSPLIKNLLIMDSYDFTSDLNVNILGHIFEQSISDIESLKSNEVSKRKKNGVFYTPEYVTDHICRTTIISYLSKSNKTSTVELVDEYEDDLDALNLKIKNLKILDPACGSGAFLVKSVDILFEIDAEIQSRTHEHSVSQKGMDEFTEIKDINLIVQNNIYGVDVNPESVEITKLSLFLKLAGPQNKLTYLSNNIKVGNSLIDDKNIHEKAFLWESEFPEILNPLISESGFDVILGNPPYLRVQLLEHKHIDWFKKTKLTAYKRIDASGLFFELGKNLLKNNGVLSFITSNQFVIAEYGLKTRELLLQNFQILGIIDFGWLPVFEDASTYVSIFNLKKASPKNFQYLRITEQDLGKEIRHDQSFEIKINELDEKPWRLWDESTLNLLTKLDNFSKISDIGCARTGLITGLDDVFLFSKNKFHELELEKDILLPVLTGTDPDRYEIPIPNNFVIYPYELKNENTEIISEDIFQNKFPKTYDYILTKKDKLLKRKDSRKTFESKKNWFGLTRFGKLNIFKNLKIVTPGEVKQNKFTIDKDSGFLNARVFCVNITDSQYNLYYVLGMLNSKVVQFYLHKTAPLKQGGYYSYATKFLNNVPIPLLNDDSQKQVIERVQEIISLKENIKNKKDEFLDLLKSNSNLKINKKLSKFFELEFEALIKEFMKQKYKPSLEKQMEWRQIFSNLKKYIQLDNEKIIQIENEIEDLSYKYYDISSDEKLTLIEN